MDLNEAYKAINNSLGITREQRREIMANAGLRLSNSMLDGFWRRPDDGRYKLVSKPVLLAFCLGVVALFPPDDTGQAAALRRVADVLNRGGRLTDDMMRAFEPP